MQPTYDPCRLCPRACGAHRLSGKAGLCGASSDIRVARASLHLWEEPPISGTNGSGTVFFSGCPLGCVYCQNRDIALGKRGHSVTLPQLVRTYRALAAAGAHNLNLVTATQYLPDVIRSVSEAKRQGVLLPVVWNTSGYETVESVKALSGTVDIWLTDFRYFSPGTAAAYSHAPDYPEAARAALRQMYAQTGAPVFGDSGLMKKGVIVRLLLLPGHLIEAKRILHELWERYGDGICLSLMSQYTPMPGMQPPLDRRVGEAEYRSFVAEAERLGITRAFTQEREAAADSFIPPFDDPGLLCLD